MPTLREPFAELGGYALEHGMRLSFHPDHFTVLSTPREEVLRNSLGDLDRHVTMLEAMGLDESAKCNIHVGGTYGDKPAAAARFIERFKGLPERIRRRMTLENDDKTFTAAETLDICEQVGAPMVLDIHHHEVNRSGDGEAAEELWPRIMQTWSGESAQGAVEPLPPKIHVSSPKSASDPRSHADFIEAPPLFRFLRAIAPITPRLDIMIEAKRKDEALLQLMDDVRKFDGATVLSQASFEL
ncbi:UV DNA damage endonuclease [Paenibacillus konkukensis]|uniref:UV DNA damage endonuclease n=1 Tax=Paenibacillus konkukensis TaxID=2020716 RepID=A0ABY4RPE3_9BACL|nr:UV DNA damage endonuclease [Paenibacillus konkukensis]